MDTSTPKKKRSTTSSSSPSSSTARSSSGRRLPSSPLASASSRRKTSSDASGASSSSRSKLRGDDSKSRRRVDETSADRVSSGSKSRHGTGDDRSSRSRRHNDENEDQQSHRRQRDRPGREDDRSRATGSHRSKRDDNERSSRHSEGDDSRSQRRSGRGRDEERERRHKDRGDRSPRHGREAGGSGRLKEHESSSRNKERREPPPASEPSYEDDFEPYAAEEFEAYEEDFEDYEDDFEEVDEEGGQEDQANYVSQGSGIDNRGAALSFRQVPASNITVEVDQTDDEEEGAEEDQHLQPQSTVQHPEDGVAARAAVDPQMLDVIKAMEEENRRATSPRRSSHSPSQPDHRGQQGQADGAHLQPPAGYVARPVTRMNFRRANRGLSSAAANKAAARAKALRSLIELEAVTFSLFELAPQTQYERYLRNFGINKVQQAAIQCGNESDAREVQTDPILLSDAYTQHPPTAFPASKTKPHVKPRTDEDLSSPSTSKKQRATPSNMAEFADFVERAGNVCLALLNEQVQGRSALPGAGAQSQRAPGSDRRPSITPVSTLSSMLPLLAGRHIVACSSGGVGNRYILTAHSDPPVPSTALGAGQGLLCLWNILDPSKPEKLLVCEGEPTCCYLNSSDAGFALAGTDTGCVLLWDLQERASRFKSYVHKGTSYSLRAPSFTAGGLMGSQQHSEPISVIERIGSSTSTDAGIQFATLDEGFCMYTWNVVRDTDADDAGSASELGLRPGSSLKLVHSSSTRYSLSRGGQLPISATLTLTEPVTPTALKFSPASPNHLLIGTSIGFILRRVRFGAPSSPRRFHAPPGHETACRYIDFHPTCKDFFVAAFSSGAIALFHLGQAHALKMWSAGDGLLSCQWLPSSDLHVLAVSKTTLFVWNVAGTDTKPSFRQRLAAADNKSEVITSASVTHDRDDRLQITACHAGGAVSIVHLSGEFGKTPAADQTAQDDMSALTNDKLLGEYIFSPLLQIPGL